jgi:hypothetical protein
MGKQWEKNHISKEGMEEKENQNEQNFWTGSDDAIPLPHGKGGGPLIGSQQVHLSLTTEGQETQNLYQPRMKKVENIHE